MANEFAKALDPVLRLTDPDWVSDPAPEIFWLLKDILDRRTQLDVANTLLDTHVEVRRLHLEIDNRRIEGLSRLRAVLDKANVGKPGGGG